MREKQPPVANQPDLEMVGASAMADAVDVADNFMSEYADVFEQLADSAAEVHEVSEASARVRERYADVLDRFGE